MHNIRFVVSLHASSLEQTPYHLCQNAQICRFCRTKVDNVWIMLKPAETFKKCYTESDWSDWSFARLRGTMELRFYFGTLYVTVWHNWIHTIEVSVTKLYTSSRTSSVLRQEEYQPVMDSSITDKTWSAIDQKNRYLLEFLLNMGMG